MGNPGNSYLWYYAICVTRCTYNMHGISRFNGIFHSGRRRNYQTSSIPSRLAPMSFFKKKKKKTMPSPYKIWILSNNSMAFGIWYEQTILFVFHNMWLCIEVVVWNKGYSGFDLMDGGSVSASQTLSLLHSKSLSNIYIMKEYKKKDHFHFSFVFRIKKTLWDCWIANEIDNKIKYLKQRNHHSIFGFLLKKDGKWLTGSDRSYFSLS